MFVVYLYVPLHTDVNSLVEKEQYMLYVPETGPYMRFKDVILAYTVHCTCVLAYVGNNNVSKVFS